MILINPDADVLSYELDAETRAEVPWPGGARSEMTYEQYRQRNFDAPDSDPSGILIATYQGRYAGLTIVRFRKDGMAHTIWRFSWTPTNPFFRFVPSASSISAARSRRRRCTGFCRPGA